MVTYLSHTQQSFNQLTRWASVSASERKRWASWLWNRKRVLYLHRSLANRGHFMLMIRCRWHKRDLGRPLTPADRAWVRQHYAAEIAASIKPLKRDQPGYLGSKGSPKNGHPGQKRKRN